MGQGRGTEGRVNRFPKAGDVASLLASPESTLGQVAEGTQGRLGARFGEKNIQYPSKSEIARLRQQSVFRIDWRSFSWRISLLRPSIKRSSSAISSGLLSLPPL
jgi:hypothetical protein